MKLLGKNYLNSCYKTAVDREQWRGSIIGISPKKVSCLFIYAQFASRLTTYIMILTARLLSRLYFGCYQLLMLLSLCQTIFALGLETFAFPGVTGQNIPPA